MRHLNGDEARELSGFGEFADVHEGPDGNLYEWVEGLSAWGEPVGFWQGLSEVPVAGPAPTGLGALYQASDGSLYQMHGLGEDEPEAEATEDASADASEGSGDGAPAPKMGPGRPGEIRVGPDGKRYRWVLGIGAGGKRTGFWRRFRPRRRAPGGAAPGVRRGAPASSRRPGPRPGSRPPAGGRRKRKPLLKRLLPLAKVAASLIPVPGAGAAVRAGLTVADKLLTKKKGVAGYGALGALYQAPDGSLYQVQGIDEDELNGLYETDGFEGLAAEDDVNGLEADNDLGLDEGDDIHGYEDAESGVGADDALDGYVRDVPTPTLQAYVPEKPPETRMFETPREPPDLWKPLW